MILEEILWADAELTDEERHQLWKYIDQTSVTALQLTSRERTQLANAALHAIGSGLNQAQLEEMAAMMTEFYMQDWDRSKWTERPIS